MVAYNFKSAFHGAIISRQKRQTVRASGRKRHAKPGERVQIYAGLRTKDARKLIPDPVCSRVDTITITVDDFCRDYIEEIVINGIPLTDVEEEAFAQADGFTSRKHFGRFWLLTHGLGRFEGVVIHWECD